MIKNHKPHINSTDNLKSRHIFIFWIFWSIFITFSNFQTSFLFCFFLVFLYPSPVSSVYLISSIYLFNYSSVYRFNFISPFFLTFLPLLNCFFRSSSLYFFIISSFGFLPSRLAQEPSAFHGFSQLYVSGKGGVRCVVQCPWRLRVFVVWQWRLRRPGRRPADVDWHRTKHRKSRTQLRTR